MLPSTKSVLLSLLIAMLAQQSLAASDGVLERVVAERHGVNKGQMQAAISTIRSHYGKDYGAQISAFCNSLLQSNATLPAADTDSSSHLSSGAQPDVPAGTPDASGDASTGVQGQPNTEPILGDDDGLSGISARSARSSRSHSRVDRKAKVKTHPGHKASSRQSHAKHAPLPGMLPAKTAIAGALLGDVAGSVAVGAVGAGPHVSSSSSSGSANASIQATPASAVSSDGTGTPATDNDTTEQGANTNTTLPSGPNGPISSPPASSNSSHTQTFPDRMLPPFLRHFDQRILKEACQLLVNSTLPHWMPPTPASNRPRPPWWTQVADDPNASPVNTTANGSWPTARPWTLPTVTVTVTETITVTASPTASATP